MNNHISTASCKRCGKGISPLVASVLLIAVTMTIAGVLAYWAAGFVRTSLPVTNETESQCRFADFSIYSCSYANRTLNIILNNLQNVELRTIRVYLIFPNSTVSDSYELAGTLPGVMMKSYTLINMDDFSKISIKTQCANLEKERTCSKS